MKKIILWMFFEMLRFMSKWQDDLWYLKKIPWLSLFMKAKRKGTGGIQGFQVQDHILPREIVFAVFCISLYQASCSDSSCSLQTCVALCVSVAKSVWLRCPNGITLVCVWACVYVVRDHVDMCWSMLACVQMCVWLCINICTLHWEDSVLS